MIKRTRYDILLFAELALSVAFSLVFSAVCFLAEGAYAGTEKRTEIRLSKAQRSKFKDLSQSLQMASITPLINAKDEVICMSIGEIHDKIISQVLKVEVDDCFSEVKAYKTSSSGKLTSEVISVLSPSDAMMLYQGLVGASKVDVDLKRKKKIIPMTYLMD